MKERCFYEWFLCPTQTFRHLYRTFSRLNSFLTFFSCYCCILNRFAIFHENKTFFCATNSCLSKEFNVFNENTMYQKQLLNSVFVKCEENIKALVNVINLAFMVQLVTHNFDRMSQKPRKKCLLYNKSLRTIKLSKSVICS